MPMALLADPYLFATVAFVLGAVVAELLELRLAGQTIHIEMRDVLEGAARKP